MKNAGTIRTVLTALATLLLTYVVLSLRVGGGC